MAVSNDAIVWAYRLILGREPSDALIAQKALLTSQARLTRDLLRECGAFAGAQAAVVNASNRPAVAWISGGESNWSSDPALCADLRGAVTWAYRLILGREPESEKVVEAHMRARGRIDLVNGFLGSEEFRDRSRHWNDRAGDDDDLPPLPPLQLRRTVGPVEEVYWQNPKGLPAFGSEVPPEKYESVFDFGCGCGRTARQLMQQLQPPSSYLGIDLNRDSIDWCVENLTPVWRNCRFVHVDAHHGTFNRESQTYQVPFPTRQAFTLVNAHSVFTHITEPNVDFYLSECVRVLAPPGVFRATWFLFDKAAFPMMQEFQNCLYINLHNPANATIYDLHFVERKYEEYGLTITKVIAPAIRGFHWILIASRTEVAGSKAAFPEDTARVGIVRPPV